MARLELAAPILAAVDEWKQRCLLNDGSVFTNERLWTTSNLQELDVYFVQNLEMGEGDFLSKLEAQLAPASPGAKKLAAEMFWLIYLIVHHKAMGAETKRYQVRKIWGWSGEDLPEDHPLLGDLLGQGVAHPGTAYNTHRWREFLFFVTLMQAWKLLDPTRREELLADPWGCAEWIEAQENAAGRQLRHVLLYLLFPDSFERIATSSHKKKIIQTFMKRWSEEPGKVNYRDRIAVDRALFQVRERVAEDKGVGAEDLDFYDDDLTAIWRPESSTGGESDTEWADPKEAKAWLQREIGDCAVWLLTVPGGGRLWPEFREGDFIAISGDYLGDLTEYESRDKMHAAIAEETGHDNPRNASLAVWQFSHKMKEGDVVIAKEGIRRLLGWGRVRGEYAYDPTRGEYQHVRFVEWVKTGKWELVGDEAAIATKTLTEFRKYPSWTMWALDRMGAPDETTQTDHAGDSYPISEALRGVFLEPKKFTAILDSLGRRKNVILQGPPGVGKTFLVKRIAYALIGRRDPARVQLVQFHQSYSYEDFVQGWRPTKEGGFELRDGVFHQFCSLAAADPSGDPYVFVIDEINRGNLSRILGELLMLIERDKRGPEHKLQLSYSSEDTFFVPENVYLIGLMNTADRSLAMVDYALRRRFGFMDLVPAYGLESFSDHLLQHGVAGSLVTRINDRMGQLNRTIREDRRNLGPGYEIGHSYFVPSGSEDELDDSWFESIVRTEIEPLVREYWFDDPKRADERIGALLG